jgi:peptide/nickel transport system substrate-binding protein
MIGKSAFTVIFAAGLAAGLTACSSGASSSSAGGSTYSSHVLRSAFSAGLSPLDPDTYYEAEGLAITTAAYQTLLAYRPNSSQLEGLLATSWSVSPDGLTYTFQLRPGVRFSDGTPFNSAAVKATFERRITMKGGPSYMLAEVSSMDTPSPHTFVVHLKQPVAPFLNYLASPYGPLMTSPAAVAQHAASSDHAAGWLADHTAGTGPYVLASVRKGVGYVLAYNKDYWGPKPYFTKIVFSIVPDFSTQLLELENGQLDMVLQGLSTQEYQSLAANSKYTVVNAPALFKAQVWINPASAVFGPMAARRGLQAALNVKQLTNQVFGTRGTASTQFYPAGMLPNGAVPDSPAYHPALLPAAVSGDKGKKVVIGYYGDNSLQQLADHIQVTVQNAGLNATVQPENPAQVFALPTTPSARPDLLVASMNPDAAQVDTWSRIYQYTNGAVNFLGCRVSSADHTLNQALVNPSPARSQAHYVAAGDLYRNSLCWINIADVHDTIAARAGLCGWSHELPWVFVTEFATLRPCTR